MGIARCQRRRPFGRLPSSYYMLLWLTLLTSLSRMIISSVAAQEAITDNNASQDYELTVALEGRLEDEILKLATKGRFKWFMQNLTQDFAPELATQEEAEQVTTTCSLPGQRAEDHDRPGGKRSLQEECRNNRDRTLTSFLRQQGDEPVIIGCNTTYIYAFTMNYTSVSVDVRNYTQYYEQTIAHDAEAFTSALRQWLGANETAFLELKGVDRVPVTDGAVAAIAPSNMSGPAPTMMPTATISPSSRPSISLAPTATPAPSDFPTFQPNSTSSGSYSFWLRVRQVNGTSSLFTDKEDICNFLVLLMPAYTPQNHDADHVEATCPYLEVATTKLPEKEESTLIQPEPADDGTLAGDGTELPDDDDDQTINNTTNSTLGWLITVRMRYESAVWNVSTYPDAFGALLNNNGTQVADRLEDYYNLTERVDMTLTNVQAVDIQTNGPTVGPTASPTIEPTRYFTTPPTTSPSTAGDIGTSFVTPDPETNNTTMPPTSAPSNAPAGDNHTVVIVVVVAVMVLAGMMMLGLFLFYLKRRAKLEREANVRPTSRDSGVYAYQNNSQGIVKTSTAATFVSGPLETHEQSLPNLVKERSDKASTKTQFGSGNSPKVAVVSETKETMRASGLLSEITEDVYDDDGDDDDYDPTAEDDTTTQSPPLDEFERYKDKNLENMRSRVEHNVTGLDDMMSQAMTMALMTDETSAPPWHGATTGVEIEANALWDVTEWLRRNRTATEDDKQEYMHYMLNKMVTSVRVGMMGPEDASRTIHECAALLGLELANQLPLTTIVLSGMQKTTTTQDVIKTFRAFGPIQDVAVASSQRGFGLLRYKHQKAANETMHKFRSSEIVVKDVAITLKILSPIMLQLSNHSNSGQ